MCTVTQIIIQGYSGLNKFSSHLIHAPKIILLRGAGEGGGAQYRARRRLPSCGLGLVVFVDMNTFLYTCLQKAEISTHS